MKKLLLATLAVLAVGAPAAAKSASQLRVYINPGHGGWTGNDRAMNVIGHSYPDTCAFYESNTNLQKGFGMMEKLIEMGVPFNRANGARNLSNNIVLSRVKNGAGQDRDLLEIAAECQNNNFDYFLSIHSNAASEATNTNFPFFEYHGLDSKTGNDGTTLQNNSWHMADATWGHIYENTHQKWTHYSMTNKNLRGEVSFNQNSWAPYWGNGYLACLGVMHHATPGFLAEGYFHTYQPSRHRAMNWDVCRVEGTAYARGVADYFGFAKDHKGIIYGIIRQSGKEFSHDLYHPNTATNDKYLPLNGVKVYLRQNGNIVAEYTTDNYYNGAFVFNVEPGTYTVECVKSGYANTTASYTVSSSKTLYPELWMSPGSSTPVDPVTPPDPSGNTVDYPDPVAEAGFSAQDSYTFYTRYIDQPVSEISGRMPRRVVARRDRLYILAVGGGGANPVIIVYDTHNKRVLRNLSLNGLIAGNARHIGDMALTADDVVVVTNETVNQFSDEEAANAGQTRGYTRMYRWANDSEGLPTGNPVEIGSSPMTGNWLRANAGHAMSYRGTINDGRMVVCAINTYDGSASNGKMFYNVHTIKNGAIASSTHINVVDNDYSWYSKLGELFTMHTSPGNSDYICFNSRQNQSRQYYVNADSQNMTDWCAIPDAALGQGAYGVGYFKYGNQNYMAMPQNSSDGANTGIRLINVSDYGNASLVSTSGTGISSRSVSGNAACDGIGYILKNAANTGQTRPFMDVYLVRDGAVTKFSTMDDYTSGVENISVDPEENPTAEPARFFNLSGQEMPAGAQLRPGIYIRVQNGKATKTVVR